MNVRNGNICKVYPFITVREINVSVQYKQGQFRTYLGPMQNKFWCPTCTKS